jgi:RND family efflux transporter MFP subunit
MPQTEEDRRAIMNIKKVFPILIVAFASIGTWALLNARPEVATASVAPPALLVDVIEAERDSVTFSVMSQGSVAPRTQTTLVAEAAGQIVEVAPVFVSGGFFRKNDVLIRIDPRNYESAVKRARAAVARAETQLATETATASYAREDYLKLQRLNPNTAPASALALRKPQLLAAMAELQSAQADLEKAEGDLDRTVIRAPYDGLVRQKIADIGQYVNVGTQLAVTFAIDIAEVRLPVTQNDLQYLELDKLRSGVPLNVELKAEFGGETTSWPALVTRTEGVFDAETRVLYLVAQVPDPYGLETGAQGTAVPLLMGTFVSAEIDGRSGGDLFVVPRQSIYRGETIWLVDDNSTIRPSTVDIVRSDEQYFYVSGGIVEGDRYCATAVEQPLPGMKVRVSS